MPNKHESDVYSLSDKEQLKKIKRMDDKSTQSIYGIDTDLYNLSSKEFENIRKLSNSIASKYKQTSGDNIIEFFNIINNNKHRDKSKRVDRTNKLTKMLNDGGMELSSLLHNEGDRFQRYSNYEILYKNIPELAQGLDTYVDNIMSPDDFTKTIFNIMIKDSDINNIETDDDEFLKVINNVKNLIEKYDIESKTKEILTTSLKLGDSFVAVLDLKEELNQLLNEDRELILKGDNYYGRTITVDDLELSDEEMNIYNEEFQVLNVEKEYGVSAITESMLMENYNSAKSSIKQDIVNKINNNFEVKPYHYINETQHTMERDFGKNKFDSNSDLNAINGSSVKFLDPYRTVKLSVDKNMVYGYYYFHLDEGYGNHLDMPTMGSTTNSLNSFSLGNDGTDIKPNLEKERMITDIFVRGISKKIDKKFVNDHPEFKNVIYSLLQNEYIRDRQISVIYLSPDQVVHFGEGEHEYYNSIYKNILFIAKLYLAVLLSTLMTKLVRSPEKRAFYIDTDIDADVEEVIQAFVRDIKSKDISMNNFKDINTLFDNIGTFQDYFIPVFDGNRNLEIDTIQGLNADLDDDFLEFLKRAMISGLGIPPDFLGQLNEPEFARSLAMQNSKFVRSIIVKQKIYGKQFTEFIRLLYKNEYMQNDNIDSYKFSKSSEDKYKEEISDLDFDLDDIRVEFPSPSSLNMTNLSEQISNSEQVIEFIVSSIMGEEGISNQPELYEVFKKNVTKDMLSIFDWSAYENIYKQSKNEYNRDKILSEKNVDEDQEDSGW